jgi:hypothetical protein
MTMPIEKRASAEEEYHRTAFGLALAIDPRISIPGLGQNPHSVTTGPPTRVRLNADELHRRWDALTMSPVRARELRFGQSLLMSVDFAEPAGYLLWARDFGRVLVSSNGTELICEPDPANDNWASIIAAQALPLAATIRGLEVFHASGVVFDGKALLFAGPPGAGKSSLAAALVRAGAELLSDDVVALALSEGALSAHAGSVVLRLRAAEDEQLSTEERMAVGHSVSSVNDRHRYISGSAPEAAPLGSMFLLERSPDEPAAEQLEAVDPFELIASTFNLSVRTPARLRRQLDIVSAIASAGLTYRLRVQPGVGATQLAAIVQAYIAWTQPPGGATPSGAHLGSERLLEL